MPRMILRVVSPDEVSIRREGETAVIEYSDPKMGGGTHLRIGPRLARMTDAEVIELHNEMVRNMQAHRRENPYVAVEIPEGRPQIEYSKECGQWVPRGNVLRCYIEGPEGSSRVPDIEIDGRVLNWKEFGALIAPYAGWGMRIAFVPDDETAKPPSIVVGEPDEVRGEGARLLKMKPEGSS